MARIFISFAIEDQFARNNLVHQARRRHVPFTFTDMSLREPFTSMWKTRCRERIARCDGMIAFVSDNTYNAEGARWEINCADEEGIRVRPVYIHDYGVRRLAPELRGRRIYHWTWDNIANFLNSLR